MRSPIATLYVMAMLSGQIYAADTIGVIANGTVVMVAPAPTVYAFICAPAWRADTCWPSVASSSMSALVSSLAPTQHVWASIAGAPPRWVPLSSVTLSGPTTPPPNPPPTAQSPTAVSWVAPSTMTDGSPLTDVSGWKVYIGTASGSYASPVSLPAATTSYTLPQVPGTYYIVVTAVSAANGEGRRSAEVSITIPPPQVLRCTSASTSVTGMQATITTTCTYGP